MGKYKKNPKYNVVSIRVTDEEKAIMDELKRNGHKNMSMLLREAMNQYERQFKVSCSRAE